MNVLDTSHPDYHSYLLRLWRVGTRTPWRAAAQCTATEQVYHFASVEALFAFLLAQLATGEDPCVIPAAPPSLTDQPSTTLKDQA